MNTVDRSINSGATALADRGSAWYLAGVCLTASLGGLLFGFDMAVISGTIKFVGEQFALGDFGVGWFVTSALVGCLVGASVAGALSDRFGRKPILILAALCFLFCAIFSAVPPSFQVLFGARILGGVGVGMASVLAPMFISEFAPPRWRGRLVGFYQLSIVIGILAAYLSNWMLLGLARDNPRAFGGEGWMHWIMVKEVWRGMFGVGAVPAAAFFALLLFVPESPRWLVKAGQSPRALGILARIGGRAVAHREMAEIQEALDQEEGSLAELLNPGLRFALIVAVGIAVFGQFSGVTIVVYYGPEILRAFHLEIDAAFLWQVVLGIINFIFTVIALFMIDRLGRRPLLIGGMTAITFLLAAIGALLVLKANPFVIVALLCLYMACAALSICAVIWVIIAEVFPNRIRGRAMSIATFAVWGVNILNVFLFPWFVNHYGVQAGFFAFAGISLVATVFFWFLVPETKGKSLEEIEKHWMHR